jgi:hypothetical protein
MRVVSLSVVLVASSASAFAQDLMSSQGSFVPSVAEADRQINIPIKTDNGQTILVPLKLALTKREESSNTPGTKRYTHAVSPSWTLVPFLDASQQIVFSPRPTQLWTGN